MNGLKKYKKLLTDDIKNDKLQKNNKNWNQNIIITNYNKNIEPMDMIGPEECTKVIVINNKFITKSNI